MCVELNFCGQFECGQYNRGGSVPSVVADEVGAVSDYKTVDEGLQVGCYTCDYSNYSITTLQYKLTFYYKTVSLRAERIGVPDYNTRPYTQYTHMLYFLVLKYCI